MPQIIAFWINAPHESLAGIELQLVVARRTVAEKHNLLPLGTVEPNIITFILTDILCHSTCSDKFFGLSFTRPGEELTTRKLAIAPCQVSPDSGCGTTVRRWRCFAA